MNWFDKVFNVGHALRDNRGLGKILNKVFGSFDDILKSYTGSGATTRDKENADIALDNQRLLNAEEYARKEDWYNEHESYEAQVRQMKQAGLNTALMYGGSPSASASGGIGSPGSASVSPSGVSDILGSVLGFLDFGLRRRKTDAELTNIAQDSETKALSNKEKRIDLKYQEKLKKLDIERRVRENARIEAEEKQIRANIPLILKNTEYAEYMALYAPEFFESTIGKNRADALRAASEVSLNEKQIENLDAVIKVHKKEIQEIDKKIALMQSEIELNVSNKDLNEQSIQESKKRIDKMTEEIKQIGKQIGLTEKDIEYYIWNHPRQSGGPLGIRWNNSSDNGRTNKVAEGMSENDMIFLLQNAGYTVEKR